MTATFNPPKIKNGHNLHLLDPDEDIAMIESVIHKIGDDLGSSRYRIADNWKVVSLELSQNRPDDNPQAFVYSFASIAHEQRQARMITKDGYHTVAFGPRTRELRLYAKGPQFKKVYGREFPGLIEEANRYIRFERTSNRAGTERLLGGDRYLSSLFKFLGSVKAKFVLDMSWTQLPRVQSAPIARLADALLISETSSQVRAILGFRSLAEEIGENAAAQKLGIARGTLYSYRKSLETSQATAASSSYEPLYLTEGTGR